MMQIDDSIKKLVFKILDRSREKKTDEEKNNLLEIFMTKNIIFSNPKLDNKLNKNIIDNIGTSVLTSNKNKYNNFNIIPKEDIRLAKEIEYEEYLILFKYNIMLYFNLSIYLKESNKVERKEITLNHYIIPGGEIKYKCKICGGGLLPESKQTRSIDEPENVMYICLNNKKHAFLPEDIEL